MRIAVCDDEKLIRDTIAERIKKLYPFYEILKYKNGEKLLENGTKEEIANQLKVINEKKQALVPNSDLLEEIIKDAMKVDGKNYTIRYCIFRYSDGWDGWNRNGKMS